MLRSLLFACAVVAVSNAARAAEMQFPYEAMVAGDDVVVRSGPGKNYYATSKLERDMQVVVHRHDPGGWFMITPPPGSISWIEATLVERTGNRGIVNPPNDDQGRPGQAVVRIGSTISDDHGYTGRRLSSGDEVEIIGEQTLAMPQGPIRMLQIAPPLREYRWVKGDLIVPADPALRQHADSDPYAVPTHHRGTEAAVAIANELPALPAPVRKSEKKTATAEDAPSPAVLATHSQRMQLLEIDNRYADMLSQNIALWRLPELRTAYEALKGQVDSSLAPKIDVRLSALAEREKLYDNYARFSQLTAATEQRDAELLGMAAPAAMSAQATMNVVVQSSLAPPSAPQMAQTQMQMAPAPTIMPTGNSPPAVQLGVASNVPRGLLATAPPTTNGLPTIPSLSAPNGILQASGAFPATTPNMVTPASGVQSPAAKSPFAGAGIIQATNLRGAGVPQFMITAADGKFLAFIDSATVNLRGYVGQSMGLTGSRANQPNLRADLIQVQAVTPIQLVGAR